MLQNINIRDNHVEVGLVLPWKNHIYIDYTVSCQWPPSPSDHPGSSPVSVSGVSGPGLGPWVYAGSGIIHYSISIEGRLFVSLLYIVLSFVTQIHSGAKRMHFFSNVTFFYFQYKKNYVNTKTTCNKCSFDYLHWLLNYGKLYWKDGVLLAVHTSGASPQSSASHLLTFLVAQLQFLRDGNFQIVDCTRFSNIDFWFEVTPKKEIAGRYQKHAFFLRHPVHQSIFVS